MNLKLTNFLSQTILNKKFKANYDVKGYDAQQVDIFFDQVIEKVKQLENQYDLIKKQKLDLESELLQLKQENQNLKKQIKALEESGYQILTNPTAK